MEKTLGGQIEIKGFKFLFYFNDQSRFTNDYMYFVEQNLVPLLVLVTMVHALNA